MDSVLRDQGNLLAAKARLIADDVMWPAEIANREYLTSLPRDEYDEFLWSLKDGNVAFGNFDKEEWSFVFDQTLDMPETTSGKVNRIWHRWTGRPYKWKQKFLEQQIKEEPNMDDDWNLHESKM